MNESLEHKEEVPGFTPEIAALGEPVYRIMKQLRAGFEQGQYQVIIGDDASGRIPALIVGEVAGKICHDAGREQPMIRFFAGSRFYGTLIDKTSSKWLNKKETIKETLSLIDWHSKALLVTETISTGASLELLIEQLRELGIQHEIAVVSLNGESEPKKKLEEKLGVPIYAGGSGLPPIYNKKTLSGVVKKPQETYAVPLREADESADNFSVKQSREDVHILAEHIYERLKEEK